MKEAGVPNEPDVFSQNTTVFSFPLDQGNSGKIKPATEVSIYKQAMMLIMLQREWSDNAVSNTLYFKPKWNLIKRESIEIPQEPHDEILDYLSQLFPETSWFEILKDQEIEYDGHKVQLSKDIYTDAWTIKVFKYDPNHEEDELKPLLASIIPHVKSISILPHAEAGVYRQTPEEGITQFEYYRLLDKLPIIDWSQLSGSDGQDERYCEGPNCKVIN